MEKEKIVSIEDRIPKLKQARKKKANRKLLFYLSIFFFLISIIIYLQSPLSNVKEIKVIGNSTIDDKEILELTGITTETNIWTIQQNQITEKLATHPIVDTVDVSRQFPNNVKIEVIEHKIVGYVYKTEEEAYYPVLSDGTIPQVDTPLNYGEAPLLMNFEEEQYLQRMINELNDVPNKIFNLISEISWQPTEKNKYKIVLYMNDGFIVHATIRNFATKMQAYPSVVSQLDPNVKGIVHMNVGTYFEEIKD